MDSASEYSMRTVLNMDVIQVKFFRFQRKIKSSPSHHCMGEINEALSVHFLLFNFTIKFKVKFGHKNTLKSVPSVWVTYLRLSLFPPLHRQFSSNKTGVNAFFKIGFFCYLNFIMSHTFLELYFLLEIEDFKVDQIHLIYASWNPFSAQENLRNVKRNKYF